VLYKLFYADFSYDEPIPGHYLNSLCY